MSQGAWILGNGGIGIMEAHLGSSPVVLLVDATEGAGCAHQGPYQDGMAAYGGYDLAAALQAITKRTFVALDPVEAVQLTQPAVKHATTGEPGPVAVVIHSRALAAGFPGPRSLRGCAPPQATGSRAHRRRTAPRSVARLNSSAPARARFSCPATVSGSPRPRPNCGCSPSVSTSLS